MTALQTIAVAFAMFSALPMPQFDWNEKNMRYALCAFPLVGVVCGVLWCVCGVLPLPAAAARRVVPAAGLGHGRHPSGRLRRHLRRTFKLRRYREEAGNFKGPPLRRVRGHSAVQLLCGVFCAVQLCGVHPAGRRALDAGVGGGAGAVRAGRGGVPAGEKTPALPTPLPRRRTASACGRCWPCSAPCWPWG